MMSAANRLTKNRWRQCKLLEDINVLQIERDFEARMIAESPNLAKFKTIFSWKAYKEWCKLISLYILQSFEVEHRNRGGEEK